MVNIPGKSKYVMLVHTCKTSAVHLSSPFYCNKLQTLHKVEKFHYLLLLQLTGACYIMSVHRSGFKPLSYLKSVSTFSIFLVSISVQYEQVSNAVILYEKMYYDEHGKMFSK